MNDNAVNLENNVQAVPEKDKLDIAEIRINRESEEYKAFEQQNLLKQAEMVARRTNFPQNKLFFYLMLSLVLGVLVGAYLSTTDISESLKPVADAFMSSRFEGDFFSVLSAGFYSNFIVIVAIFLLSFSAISAPVILLAPFIKGLGYGVSFGAIFVESGINSVFQAAGFILPSGILSAILIVLCTKESLRFSAHLFMLMRGKHDIGTTPKTASTLSARFLLFCIMAVFCGVIDGVVAIIL